jgi:hypothetical protein
MTSSPLRLLSVVVPVFNKAQRDISAVRRGTLA